MVKLKQIHLPKTTLIIIVIMVGLISLISYLLTRNNYETRNEKLFVNADKVTIIEVDGWIKNNGRKIKLVDSLSVKIDGLWYNKLELHGLFFSPIFFVRHDTMNNSLDCVFECEETKRDQIYIDSLSIGCKLLIPKDIEHCVLGDFALTLVDINYNETYNDNVYIFEITELIFGHGGFYLSFSPKYGLVAAKVSDSYFILRI